MLIRKVCPPMILMRPLFVVIAYFCSCMIFATEVDFNRDIRPILNQHCVACHGGVKQAGDISFVYRDQAMYAIEPGSPDASTLIDRVISDDEEERMPPAEHGRKLTDDEVALLRKWIEEGAEWGDHWAFVAPLKYNPPAADQVGWSKSRIDKFVYEQLQLAKLQPNEPATPEAWLRRVTLDLTGVPPTVEERAAFLDAVGADGEKAYADTVDRLIASKRYGERWASVWLDAVRYADSRGLGQDGRRTMWKYRDWVIDAFNEDLPFDQFTIKQIAGDLLPDASLDDLVATACHRLTQTNEEGGTDDEQFRIEAVIDRVNTTWQTWQGLTFGCVQCHSHPYDPIKHEEYYQALAFFNNTDDWDLTDDAPHVSVPVHSNDYPQAQELSRQISQLKKQQWESSLTLLNNEANWKYLKGIQASSSTSTKYEIVEHEGIDEFRTVGTIARDTKLTVESPVPEGLTKLTAIRFTGLPVNPEKAKLFAEVGFVISFIEGRVLAPDKEPVNLQFAYVIGDEFAPPMNPQESLNPQSKEGFGAYTRMNYARSAAFVLEAPVELPENARIEISISQNILDLDSFQLVASRGRFSVTGEDSFIDWLKSSERIDAQKSIAELEGKLSKIHRVSIPQMRERPVAFARPTAVFQRGDILNPGEVVQADTPDFLPGLSAHGDVNRLDFAKWLASEKNPLTSRVAVNRFWAQLFGVGLVETQEDFGSSGENPSHPQLLDDLAARFATDMKWSVKSLLKEIVLSSTYRQSSKVTDDSKSADANNRLLSRGPRVRLPAETVRDQALAISGLLTDKMYGPPTYPPLPEGVWLPFQGYEKWNTPEKGDPERYRRTIYSYTKRSIPLPIMASFDAPSREFCSARRLKSNTPLQALMTLNDITFVEAAEALVARMCEHSTDLNEQIKYGFIRTTCREPNEAELQELLKLYQQSLSDLSQDSEVAKEPAAETDAQGNATREALESVAIVMLNLDEIFTN